MSFAQFQREVADDVLDRESQIQDAQAAREETAVRFVLKHFNLDPRTLSEEESKISFGRMLAVYGSFPMRLQFEKIPLATTPFYDLNATMIVKGHIKDPFYTSRAYKAWRDFKEDDPTAGCPSGIVIPCVRVRYYVIHDGLLASYRPGSRLCKTSEDGKILIIEPLRQLLDELLDVWTPRQ